MKLSEIMDISVGGTPDTKNNDYWNGSIPWLSVKDFNSCSRYVYTTEKSITQEGLTNSATKLLEKDDLIISARGTVGSLAMIPFSMAYNQSCYGLRAKKEFVSPSYLFYLLKCKVSALLKNSHGSVFDTITIDTFSNIKVELPSKEEQERVSRLLCNIDDKIECNNRINDNLVNQARMLYVQLSKSINCLTEYKLSDIVDVRDGTHDSPSFHSSGYPLITSKHLQPFCVDKHSANLISESDYNKINERSKVDTNDILISMIGTVGLVSLVVDPNVNFAIKNVGLLKTSSCPNLIFYIHEYLKSAKTISYIKRLLAGSTQKYISLGELRKLPIILPSAEQLEGFNKNIKPIMSMISNLTQENETLTSLRNTLLPLLINGQATIAD